MKTATVNISFQSHLLRVIDRTAEEEFRSRSELIREAARRYIGEKKRWKGIFALARSQVKALGLKPRDIERGIAVYRRRSAS